MSFLELLITFDQELFKLIYQGMRPEDSWQRTQIDHFMLVMNTLGEFFIALVVLVGLWYASRTPKIFWARALLLLIGIGAGAAVNGVAKDTFDRSRPARVFLEPQVEREHFLPAWNYRRVSGAELEPWFTEAIGYRIDLERPHDALLITRAFPSGHTQYSFALAAALAAYFPALALPLFTAASFTALARVYGGHHFVLDLLPGALIGWGFVILAFWGVRKLVRWRSSRAGPVPGWVRFLAAGLPEEPPKSGAPKRWAQRLSLWLAFVVYAPVVVLMVMLELPFAWAAGPLAVLTFVVGWRLLYVWFLRLWRMPRPAALGGKAEPVVLSPQSGWGSAPAPPTGYPSSLSLDAPSLGSPPPRSAANGP